MHIGTDLLKAFLEVHTEGSFTKAAKNLSITQSALSQKIARLEDLLEATLFIREHKSVSLSQTGQKLISFAMEQLEHEYTFIEQFRTKSNELSGVIRVAGYSSIMSSVLIPSLSKLITNSPKAQIEFKSFEVTELESVLARNQADIIVTDYKPLASGLESFKVGEEEFVLIESRATPSKKMHFLDHGVHDNATESFLKFQANSSPYTRGYMGDVYGIITGVEEGLGRAVMSKHIIKNNKKISIKKVKKRYLRDIYLSYSVRSYYSPLQKKVVENLKSGVEKFL